LHRLLIHAEDRLRGIIRFFVDVEHVFHVSHKLAVRFRGNHPVLNLAAGHLIQGGVLLLATVFVFVNLLVDLLYAVVDPRIRLGGNEE
jgi:hypothetical protein